MKYHCGISTVVVSSFFSSIFSLIWSFLKNNRKALPKIIGNFNNETQLHHASSSKPCCGEYLGFVLLEKLFESHGSAVLFLAASKLLLEIDKDI